jgi:hypothetical protein
LEKVWIKNVVDFFQENSDKVSMNHINQNQTVNGYAVHNENFEKEREALYKIIESKEQIIMLLQERIKLLEKEK